MLQMYKGNDCSESSTVRPSSSGIRQQALDLFRRFMGRGDTRDRDTGAQNAPSDSEEMQDTNVGDAPVARGEQREHAPELGAQAAAEVGWRSRAAAGAEAGSIDEEGWGRRGFGEETVQEHVPGAESDAASSGDPLNGA
jgi:hypothetical protein